MEYTFTVTIKVEGEATYQEVKDFIEFELGACCSISQDNPFLDEEKGAELSDVDVY
jgi:hypothetical protein